MKSDLRNLVTAEEAYFADSVKYTSNLGTAYATTTGVVGPTIVVTADGFTATVTHTTTTKTCSIYVGSTSLAPANKEGEPKCAECSDARKYGRRGGTPPLFFSCLLYCGAMKDKRLYLAVA